MKTEANGGRIIYIPKNHYSCQRIELFPARAVSTQYNVTKDALATTMCAQEPLPTRNNNHCVLL